MSSLKVITDFRITHFLHSGSLLWRGSASCHFRIYKIESVAIFNI